MTTTRNIVAGGTAQVAVRMAGLGAATLTLPLLARHLGNADYGRLTIIMVVAAITVTAGDLGLSLLLSRDLPTAADDGGRWLARFWSLRIATALILWITASGIAMAWPMDSELRQGLLVALAGVPVAICSAAIGAWFNADLDPMPAAIVDLTARITWLVGVVGCVGLGFGFTAVAGVFVASQMVALATGLALKADRRQLALPPLRLEGTLLKAAAPLALIPILGIIYTRTDTLILAAFAPAAEVGVYGALWRIVEGGMLIAAVGGSLLLPLFAGSPPAELIKRYRDGIRVVASVMFPLAVLLAISRSTLLPLLGGDGFFAPVATDLGRIDPGATLAVLMAALALMAIGTVNGALMIARRMQHQVVRHFVLTVIVNAALALWLVPIWSFMGAAVASLASEVVATAHSTLVLRYSNGRLGLATALRWPITIALGTGAGFALFAGLGATTAVVGGGFTAAALLAISPVSRQLLGMWQR